MSQKLAIAETQKLIQLVSQTKWNYQLSQFEDKATREVLKSTKRARAEITKTLAGAGKGASLKRWEKQRLTALGEELQHLSVAAQAQITGTIANAAEVAGKASYVAQNKILSFGGMIPNFHPVALSAAQLHSMVTKTPVGGKLLNKWVGDTFDYNIQKNIKSELLTGMLKGESYKDMTKRFSGKVFNGLDNDMEALTRTYVQSSNVNAAFDVAKANADIVKGWKWNSVAENRTCIRCMSLDSQDEVYSIGKGPEMPLHPRCFVSQKVPIYTSKGWKPIGEVKIGDFVLTHKHRFRKVYALPRSRQFAPDTVRIEFKKFEGVSLTANHMVQVGDPDTGKTTWKEAGDCKKGDHIMLLANRCHRCGKLIPYTQKYCGHRCVSLDITDRQWSDPEHRKNISVKNSISMNNQYTSGERDRFEITKQANKVNIEMIENGAHAFQQEDIHVLSNAANNTPDHKKRSSLRMKKKNPMHDPAVVKLVQDKLAVWRDKYPGKHPNVIMAKKGFMSGIERKMKQILDKSGVQYQAQFPVKRKGRGYYFVDFAISSLKIAIEVDGAYWHENTEKDMIRQREIEKAGWTVIRFSEERINNCLNEVTDEVTRMVCNHSELYETVPWLVTGVIKKKLIGTRNLYNLSVEEDESYIARGMVVHNCRCFPEFVTKTFREMGVDVDEIEKAYRPYTVRGTVDPLTGKIIPGKIGVGGGKIIETGRFLGTYEDFLKTQPVNVQKQILGPSRLELWKSGKVALKDFADAKGNQYLLTELRGIPEITKWKPSMTKAEADVWGKNSVVNETMYHSTSKEVAEKIRNEGFKLSHLGENMNNGGVMGAGHYTAGEEMLSKAYGEEILKTRVNVTKIFNYENISFGQARKVPTDNLRVYLGEMITEVEETTIKVILDKTYEKYGFNGTGRELLKPLEKYREKYIRIAKENKTWGPSFVEREIMKDLGYDAAAQKVILAGKETYFELSILNDNAITVLK